MKRPAFGVFLILWASYAFFWQGRDWNTASRLMLAYAMVDRGTIRIDGFEDQTGDKATYRGHFYSDKLPGYSMLAAPAYLVVKQVGRLPSHPLNVRGFAFWPADYAVTLLTSGLLTAITGAVLVRLSIRLGCTPRAAILVGLAYGLATPAYPYATLAYGHQAASACLLGSFALLWIAPQRRWRAASAVAGLLAAYASVIELQVGPVSAILGFYAMGLAIGRKRPAGSVVAFGLGALVPTLGLLAYNALAFDSPFRMGYFYHAVQQFAQVHSATNPLGLGRPDWGKLDDLLIRPARGLLWYAPVVGLTLPGLVALVVRRFYAAAIVCAATIVAVLVVNLSYPEWTGGWSTGPRLLVPMLPFAMLPVAGLLGVGNESARRATIALAAALAVLGGVVIFLFQGVGARIPDPARDAPPGYDDVLARPLTRVVVPIWQGGRLPGWSFRQRFARNLVSFAWSERVAALSPEMQWVQFLPLLVFQASAIALLLLVTRPTAPRPDSPVAGGPPARPDPP